MPKSGQVKRIRFTYRYMALDYSVGYPVLLESTKYMYMSLKARFPVHGAMHTQYCLNYIRVREQKIYQVLLNPVQVPMTRDESLTVNLNRI